jgi:hypothetical protein
MHSKYLYKYILINIKALKLIGKFATRVPK